MTTNQQKNIRRLLISILLVLMFQVSITQLSASTLHKATLPAFFNYLSLSFQQLLEDSGYIMLFGESQKSLKPPGIGIPEYSGLHRREVYIESLHFFPHTDHDIQNLSRELYSILTDVESMKGIEYYSASRESMRVLFTQSYFIRSPQNPERFKPETDSILPPSQNFWLFQQDQTFGKNIYSMNLSHSNGTIHMQMQNNSNVNYGIFPAIREQNMTIHMTVHVLDEGIAIFSSIRALPVISLGLESRIRSSMENRLVAITNWFLHKLQEYNLPGSD
ncbi:DUF6675 family protein [Spirochaeta dissipatitropha]